MLQIPCFRSHGPMLQIPCYRSLSIQISVMLDTSNDTDPHSSQSRALFPPSTPAPSRPCQRKKSHQEPTSTSAPNEDLESCGHENRTEYTHNLKCPPTAARLNCSPQNHRCQRWCPLPSPPAVLRGALIRLSALHAALPRQRPPAIATVSGAAEYRTCCEDARHLLSARLRESGESGPRSTLPRRCAPVSLHPAIGTDSAYM